MLNQKRTSKTGRQESTSTSTPSQRARQFPQILHNLFLVRKLLNLKVLALAENQLESLPEEIGDLAQLEVLHALRNNLKILPKSISKLRKLKELELAKNDLTEIPDLSNLQQLEVLSLAYNRLTNVPNYSEIIKELKTFDIRSNFIKKESDD